MRKIYSLPKIAYLIYRGINEIEKVRDKNGIVYYLFEEDSEVDFILKEYKTHEELHKYSNIYAGVINEVKRILDYKTQKYNKTIESS